MAYQARPSLTLCALQVTLRWLAEFYWLLGK
ncbi:Uncharacterised protein [Vibrio cholerae]|nr:Uncharacterised protein [Vibrio cholerae]